MNKELITILKEPINKLLSELGDEIRQIASNRILEYQSEEYNRNANVKTILHTTIPVSLKEIYQPLFLRIPFNSDNVSDWGTKIPTTSVSELFKQRQFITIIGSAGSGKSMLVKYLFIKAIEEKFKFPIKIELRYLNDYNKSLKDYIIETVFQFEKLGVSDRKIEELLDSGKFLFFFDGYDELNTKRTEKITKEIDDFTRRFNQNLYVLTSRPYTNIELLPLFHNFYLWELHDADINAFVKKQKLEGDLADKINNAIDKKENRSYKSFLNNPLLLSMFIMSFQTHAQIPQHRGEFYRLVIDTLNTRHDASSKLGFEREKKSGLDLRKIETVLETFSYITFVNETYHFNKELVFNLFDHIKSNKPEIDFDNQLLLDDLTISLSIITIEGSTYLFPHRSLQEYFAAKYISKLSGRAKRELYEQLKNRMNSTRRMDMYNFYSILEEIDERDFIDRLLIPLGEIVLSEFTTANLENKTSSEIFKYFATDYYFLEELLFAKTKKYIDDNTHYQISQKISELYELKLSKKLSEKGFQPKFDEIVMNEAKAFLIDYQPIALQKIYDIEKISDKNNRGDINIINTILTRG